MFTLLSITGLASVLHIELWKKNTYYLHKYPLFMLDFYLDYISYNREQTSLKNTMYYMMNTFYILDDLLLAFLLDKCNFYHYQIIAKL